MGFSVKAGARKAAAGLGTGAMIEGSTTVARRAARSDLVRPS
jgi:hypothetical protein